MTDLLISGADGTPLHIISTNDYTPWLEQQSQLVQNWLRSSGYEGKGMSLIPDADGCISQVIVVSDTPEDYWSCGDVVGQLPAGRYVIHGSEAHIKAAAFSWGLGAYQFDRYKPSNQTFPQLVLPTEEMATQANILVNGVAIVRDLVNTPAADMMPQHLAAKMMAMAEQFNGDFTEIVGDALLDQNYPTIHMVGRASANLPRLLDLTWGDENAPKITLVGKGVCFDSGGLDLKPAAGMRLMKKDMGGAAHVLGLAHLIMANNLPVRLRVLVPAVENAVASNAFRPGDVITTRKGLSVEIDNTDAEGRLVLCDALSEASDEKPEMIIDFATLTGAMRVALGTELPGFFSTDDTFANALTQSGLSVQDPVWRMPLHAPYKDLIKSSIADLSNCGQGPFGGAITAALYLQAFVDPAISWTHFDVMAWNNRKLAGRPIGGEAFGIRAVYDYLANHYA